MKAIVKILLLITIMPSHALGCPCCVGTIDEDSPPFFSEECYQSTQKAPATMQESQTQSNKEQTHE